MSLRMRLFLIFGGLIAVLMSAQWWMLRTMTRNLESQIDNMVFDVGSNVAAVFAPGRHIYTTHKDQDAQGTLVVENLDTHFTTEKPGHIGVIVSETDDGQDVKLSRHFEGKILVKKIKKEVKKLKDIKIKEGKEPERSEHTQTIFWHNNDQPKVFLNGTEIDASDPQYDVEVTTRETPLHVSEITENQEIVDLIQEAEENLHITLVDRGKNDFIVMTSPSIQKSIPIPKTGLANTLADLYNQLFVGSIGILLLGLLVVALVSHRFAKPLRQLAATAQKVGDGSLGAQVRAPQPNGEVGIAIHEFNKMSVRLQELDAHNQVMRQREYLSELGEIADGLAHTIRNPLNTLGLSVDQLVAMSPKNEACRELGQVSRRQISRIDQWIRSFMALASQGSSKESSVRLDGLLHDIMLEALHAGGNVALDMNLEADLPECRGVQPEIRAVVQALIINAVEASPEGGQVMVRAKRENETAVRIEVEDNGPGLPDEVRRKLFTPHVTTKVTGSGMGLFLARRIITSRYGGDLSLTDKENGGVLAVVILPLEREKAHA